MRQFNYWYLAGSFLGSFIATFGLIYLTTSIKFRVGADETIDKKLIGVTIRPFALTPLGVEDHNKNPFPAVNAQLDKLVELGANSVRFNDETFPGLDQYVVQQTKKRGLEPIMVIENPDIRIDFNLSAPDYYQKGYNYGFEQAGQFSGQVKYFQMLNEVSGTAATKPGDKGETLPNRFNLTYNKKRYEHMRDYLLGLSAGIDKAAPGAKKIVTAHWVLVDVLKYLKEDGLDYQIGAWDWYSDQGLDVHNRKIDEGGSLDIAGEVKKLGKKFWLAEVNRAGGSFGGKAKEQSNFIGEFSAKALADSDVGGFFVHLLTDDVKYRNDAISELGLLTVNLSTNTIDKPKPAFEAYKNSISQYKIGKLTGN